MNYIDDLSYVHSLELKKVLTENPSMNIPLPVSYHERTGDHLPDSENIIQEQFSKLKDSADRKEMKITHDKSKVMLVNTSQKFYLCPRYLNQFNIFPLRLILSIISIISIDFLSVLSVCLHW